MEDQELSNLIDQLVSRGASDEEIDIIIADHKSKSVQTLEAQAPPVDTQPQSGGFWDNIVKAYNRGTATAEIADVLNPHEDTPNQQGISKLQSAVQEQQANPASQSYQRFTQAGSLSEVYDAFKEDPIGILSELTVESLTPLIKHGAARIVGGAATGAAIGSVIPGLGTAGGAATGAIGGVGSTSLNLEYSSSILEALQEAGADFSSLESVQSALNNQALMGRAKEHAYKKGVPIAVFDMASAGIAGGLFKQPAKTLGKKLFQGGVELATQSALGAGGEVAGELISGEELQPGAIAAEALGELGGAPIEIASGTIARAKAQTNKLAAAQADKAIQETSTGDPAVDAAIDVAAEPTKEERDFVEQDNLAKAVDETKQESDRIVKEVEGEAKKIISDQKKSETSAEKPKESRDVEGFANKIIAGEKLTSPEDLQFYENNKKEIEEYLTNASKKTEEEKILKIKKDLLTKRIEELTEKLIDIEPGQERAIYRELLLTKQAAREIAPNKPPAKSQSKAAKEINARIEKATGLNQKQEPIVDTNPKKSRREAVQELFRYMEKGVRKGQKLVKDDILNRLRTALKEHNLGEKQIGPILTKMMKTNLFTPGSLSRLQTFIDKAILDSEYGNKISEARTINKRLRRLSKSPTALQNQKNTARSFTAVNPEDVDIDKHLELGRKVISGLTNPPKGYAPFNVEEVENYIESNLSVDEEVEAESNEVDTEEKLKEIKAILKNSQDALTTKDLSEFDDSEKRTIESIKQLDPERLTKEDLITSIKVIDNIVENDDLSNVSKVESIVKGKQAIDGIKAILGDNVKEVGILSRLAGGVNQQFKDLARGISEKASEVQRLMGSMEMFNGGARVDIQEIKLGERFKKLIKEIERKAKVDVNTIENHAKMTAFAELFKNYGTNDHIPRVKQNIQTSIDSHERAGEIEQADAWKKALELFKDVNTVQDAKNIMESDPALLDIWKFFNKSFTDDVTQRLSRVTAEVHNKPYTEANNYTHTSIVNVNDLSRSKDEFGQTGKNKKAKLKAVQSKTSIRATRNVPPGHAYALNFVDSQMRGYRESLYDIETSRAAQLLGQVIHDPEFDNVVGGKENGDLIRKMLTRAEELQRAVGRRTGNEALDFINGITGTARTLGAGAALGSKSAFLKQVPSIWGKSIFDHLGSNSIRSFLEGITAVNLWRPSSGLKSLFDQYTIGIRGERLGGIDRGERLSLNQPQSYKALIRLLEKNKIKIDDNVRKTLKNLTKSDTYAARTTWLGYYLQSLKNQGVTDIDLNTEHERQADERRAIAAAFAEQKVAENQVPSNPAAMSQASRNENDRSWNFAKSILLPFSTFSIAAKVRMIKDFKRMVATGSKESIFAVAGNMAEIAVFVQFYKLIYDYYKPLLKSVIEKMTGVDAPDEDDEKIEEKRKKAVNSLWVNQITPFAIGTPGDNAASYLANQAAYIIDNPDMSYSEWKKETGGFVYDNDEYDLGVLGIGLQSYQETVSNVRQLYQSRIKGEPVRFEGYLKGSEKEAYLNESQETVLMFKTILDAGRMMGLNEADVYRTIQKIYKEQLNEASKTSTGTPVRRGSTPYRPSRRHIPRRN